MVAAVIPCFNEENTLFTTVERTLPYIDKLILVDDGCTDSSFQNIDETEKIVICRNRINSGKGISLKKGITTAHNLGADIIITLDADLQHPPEFIPGFIEALSIADLAIGSRERTPGVMPFHRRMSNFLTSYIVSSKTGLEIIDSQCGFRAVRREFTSIFDCRETGFGFETEVLINAGKQNLRVVNVPIPTIYGNTSSKMKNTETIITFLKLMLK